MLAALFLMGTVAAAEPDAEYTVAISGSEPRVARVQAAVTVSEQTLKMLPWGHPWLPNGWATFVHELEVRDAAGDPVEAKLVEEDGWGSWEVAVEDGEMLQLSYSVRFDHDQYDWDRAGGVDSRPALSNGALFLVSRALFIYSPGVASARVRFDVPEEWQVSTPWEPIAGEPDAYDVDSWDSLVSNALVLGDYERRVIEQGGMEIILAVDGALGDWIGEFHDLFGIQLDSYGRLFGGIPQTRYLVTIRAAAEIDGESYHDSFNLVTTVENLALRKVIWANTLGHELFHYWNGANYLVGREKSRVEWFGEGFTEYYSSLTLFRAGIIDQAMYFRKLERYLARYQITRRMWPVEALSLVEAGRDKGVNWLQIYGGGATLALILDIEIRSATGGQRGLDEVMRLMKERFGDTGEPYDVEDVLDCVNRVSGSDFTAFFEAHVFGASEQLDLAQHLSKAGLFVGQFSDEFYIQTLDEPTGEQQVIWNGLAARADGLSAESGAAIGR